MKKALILAALTILMAPALATAKCWVCAGGEGGARCFDNNIPNFSMTRCQTQCLYYISTVCFCRTYGETCIEPAPFEPSPTGSLTETADPNSAASEEYRYWLTQKTLKSLQSEAGELVAGFLSWPIPATLEGPGPHRIEGIVSVDSESYDYTGDITFMYGTAVIRYEIEGHPEIKSIQAQFGPEGFGGTVLVDKSTGREVFEISGR